MMNAAERLKQADEALNLCKIAAHKPEPIKAEWQARAICSIARLERVDTNPLREILGMDERDFRSCLQMARTPIRRLAVIDTRGFSPVMVEVALQMMRERDGVK